MEQKISDSCRLSKRSGGTGLCGKIKRDAGRSGKTVWLWGTGRISCFKGYSGGRLDAAERAEIKKWSVSSEGVIRFIFILRYFDNF